MTDVEGFGICQFCAYTAHKEGCTITYLAGTVILQVPYLQTAFFMVHLFKIHWLLLNWKNSIQRFDLNSLMGTGHQVQSEPVEESRKTIGKRSSQPIYTQLNKSSVIAITS